MPSVVHNLSTALQCVTRLPVTRSFRKMPKLFPPALLENPDTRDFCLQKQITKINSLKHHLQNSVCLGIDIEGCEGMKQGITSIGIAVLPAINLPPQELQSKAFPSVPLETQEVVDRCGIEGYCIYLEDRHRKKPYSPFPIKHTIRTTREGVREEIQAILNGVKQRFKKDIIMVALSPHSLEIPGIQALCPNLFHELAGWVCVTNVTRQICVSYQENLNKTWPPLEDVLLSVGFSENCQSQRFCHNAGGVAIHAVILLIRLLTYSDSTPLEVRRRRPLKHWKQRDQDLRGLEKSCKDMAVL